MITAQNLTKKYGNKVVVNDISFVVEDGKITGFLGPNGAGKSTTMRAMLGLDNAQGSTLFDGQPLSSYPQPSQVVGILLDAKSFHPKRTARNHLKVLAQASGIPESRVDEVLTLVGLQDVANQKPGKFSLGMAQRLGIATAILGQPKHLILDEPANGLDPEGIHWLRDFLHSYVTTGNSVLISSHLLSEMQLMAHNLVIIGKGSLIASQSMESFIQSASTGAVFVRTTDLNALSAALTQQKVTWVAERNGLKVSGVTSDQVSAFLFQLGMPVLELAAENVSLEDAFLKMTSGAQEYRAVTPTDTTPGGQA